MIITSVKFYQGINIDGQVITHAQPNLTNTDPSDRARGLVISEVENGILLKKGSVATLATWNNVQYVTYELPSPADDAVTKELSKRNK